MGIIKTQTLKSSAYTYAGATLGFLITAILFPRFLSESQIGVLSLLVSYSMIFAQLGTLGFTNATIKFFPYFRFNNDHRGFLTILIGAGVAGTAIVLLLFALLHPYLVESNLEKSPLFVHFLYLIVPLTIFQLFFFLLDTYSSVLFDSTTGTFLKEFAQRIFILIALSLYIFGIFQFDGFATLYVASICIVTLFLVMHLIIKKHFKLTKPDITLVNPYIKGMAGVSFFGLLNGFSSFASLRIDAIMVNEFFDTAAVGIYTTTFHFGVLVILPARALLKIASPLIAEALKNNDKATLDSIYYKSCINQQLAGTFLLLGIWVNIDTVFVILPPEYEAGKWVILFIGIANVLKMSTGVSEAIIAYSKHYKMITWFMLTFLVVTVITNLIFIPIMGISGAALASLVAVAIYGLMRFFFVKHHFGLQPYNIKFLLVPGIGFLTAAVVYFIPTAFHYLLDMTIRSVVATILFFTMIYLLRCSEEFNGAIHQVLKRIIR